MNVRIKQAGGGPGRAVGWVSHVRIVGARDNRFRGSFCDLQAGVTERWVDADSSPEA